MKNNFYVGTLILITANAISKILGAVFKIPITYILEEEGMAIFNTAMGVYSTVLTFIISGLPMACSRFIAEEYTLKNTGTVKKSIRLLTLIFCILGIVGTLVLFFFSDFFAYAMKDPKASFAIKVISPSVFFVAWGTVYKCFYQGCSNMIPTAISQVIESLVRLLAGFSIAYLLNDSILEIKSAGAISGITLGEIIATMLLFIMFLPKNKEMKYAGETKRKRDIIKNISSVALPLIVCSCISAMLGLLDVAMVRNCLLKINFVPKACELFLLKYSSYTNLFDNLSEKLTIGIDGARWLYGAYSGYAMTIFHLPTGIIASLGVSVLPALTGALTIKNKELVQRIAEVSLKLTFIIAIPCAVVLFLFAEPILELLFSNSASAELLKLLSPGIIFLCVLELFVVFFHASGCVGKPFLYNVFGIFIKFILNYTLIRNPYFNISGAPIASVIAFFITMVMAGVGVKKHYDIKLNVIKTAIKPVIASFVMGMIMMFLYNPMCIIFKKDWLGFIVCCFVGVLSYLLSLFAVNGLNKKEFQGIVL